MLNYNCAGLGYESAGFLGIKSGGVHIDNGILFGTQKKWSIKPWKHVEEPKMHMTKLKKPIWKDYILYDSNNVTVWKRQNYC